ncbi:FCD domain-containing protein [Budvicia aquatica]|nr:FCD domain-containing protein [Budvicia aquatica]
MDSFLTGKVGPFELLQARQLIESTIAAFAATQIVKSDLEKLSDVLEQEKEYLDLPPNEELDRYFHCLVAGATQNALLTDLVRYIWDVRKRDPIWQELKQQDEQREYSQRGYEEHKAILQALQRKDPMAAKLAMWQHLENINDRVTKQLESKEPSFDRFLFESVPLDIKA